MAVLSGQQAYDMSLLANSDTSLVQPASIDVRLGRHFLAFHGNYISSLDPSKPLDEGRMIPYALERDDFFQLNPGEFVLASTYEIVSLPNNIVASFAGKSSLARLGLGVHVTAGFIDPGFTGQITIELANVNSVPILLYPGMKIGQIVFTRMERAADVPYGQAGNSYQGQLGPTPYRGDKSFIKGLPNG